MTEPVIEPIVEEPVVEPPVEPSVEPSWKDGLPDDIKGEAGFSKFDADTMAGSYDKLYRSYGELQSKLGQKGIIKPKENATDDAWEAYHKELGKPESADKYELKVPGGVEPVSKEFEGVFRDAMLNANITQSQADKLYTEVLKMEQSSRAKMAANREKAMNEVSTNLKREWGADFAGNLAMAQKAIENFGGDGAKEFLDEHPEIGNNPFVVKLVHTMAKSMSEDVISKGGVSDLVTTPAQAKAKLADIDSNQNHPYWKGDKDAIKYYRGLLAVAEGIK